MLRKLVNLDHYTPLELILFAGGCYLWVIVYYIYVRNIMKHRCIDMPIFAACGNFAWEFVWSWIMPTTDMGLLLVWAYRIWFFLDCYIIYGVVRYCHYQIAEPEMKKNYKLICYSSVIFWGLLLTFYKMQGMDTAIGANSAYILQMFISILYVILIIRQPKGVMFSYPIAWLRMVGTATNTIFMFMHYPDNYFLCTLAASSFVIDNAYIYLFIQKRKANKNWNWDNIAGVGEQRKVKMAT